MVDQQQLTPHYREQLTDIVKTFTSYAESCQATHKERITDLNKLKPGDHVSFYKTDLYYAHHGIVCEARTDYLRVIHYFNTFEQARTELMKGSLYIAEVVETELPINMESTNEDIYLHHYDNIPCYTNEETLERAFSQLGKRGYSLLGNNCEHWARWCRTGEHYSEQVSRFRETVKNKSATLFLIDPTALLVKDIALVGAQALGQFLNVIGTGIVLTAVESVSTVVDIKNKNDQRKKGYLSDIGFKKYIVRRITSASTTVVGGIVGTIVGTILIPVPILGATIGGAVGSVSGKILGNISGVALSKILDSHEKIKKLDITNMSTIPQLMNNLSPESELVSTFLRIAIEHEEKQISSVIEDAIKSYSSTHLSLLEEFVRYNSNTTPEKCQTVIKLINGLFIDSNEFDYFVLTPIPDDNAPNEFASSIDLLVLRWSIEATKPWEFDGDQVLDIDDLNLTNR